MMKTIQQLTDRFLLEMQKKNPATVSNLKKIGGFFDGIESQLITRTQVVDYIILRRGQLAKPATINRELTIMKQFFKWLLRSGLINKDPTEDIPFENGVEKRIRYITVEEEKRLISYAREWLRPVIIFATSTGLRRGEIVNLIISDVNLNNKLIIVKRSKNGEPRTVPLTNRAMSVINLEGRQVVQVFTHHGQPINPVNLEYHFRRAVHKAGLTDLHFHDLRHTFATRLVQGGVDLYRVQLLLGHKSPAMTQRYAHHNIESLRNAVEKI